VEPETEPDDSSGTRVISATPDGSDVKWLRDGGSALSDMILLYGVSAALTALPASHSVHGRYPRPIFDFTWGCALVVASHELPDSDEQHDRTALHPRVRPGHRAISRSDYPER